MKEEKHEKNKFKKIEAYSVLLLIATLFMCIGYAKISDTYLSITGTVEAVEQEGVYITSMSNISEIATNSHINYFIQTMFESRIALQSDATSTQTYEVSLYNNSNKQYVYIDTLTDVTEGTFYDNKNIEFNISGMQQYVTIIEPKQQLSFKITFKYKENADISKNILNSKLNFRFKEMPQLALSNDGKTYKLNEIYPDYTPQTYKFTVQNYVGDYINSVPLKYYFDIQIDKPLTAKIYDKNNKEVTGEIMLDENNQNKEDQEYTLKVIWDDSNTEPPLKYDSSKYENREFSCKVKLKAVVDDNKYIDFSIKKQFGVNITSGDYKDSYEIIYENIPYFDYPIEVAHGESLEVTFVKEIPANVQITGVDNYTYNRPTLVIDSVTSDIQISNNTGKLITFEHSGPYVFDGYTYIDTKAALFSEANIDRNFIISFNIVADEPTQSAYNTLVSAMDESGSPYPGFVFRIGDSSRLTKYQLTVNSAKGKGKVHYSERNEVSRVEIARINSVLYIKINDDQYEMLIDFTNFTDYFDYPLTIGAGINSSGKPFRYFKGILSNIEAMFLDESASQDIIAEINGGLTVINGDGEEKHL